MTDTALSVADWLAALDDLYPPAWAEDWDNPGLQVGDRAASAARALVALDPTTEVVAEARDRGCDLLVTHHPLLFRPAARLDLADAVPAAVAEAIRSAVAVVAVHTNADVAPEGVSDALAAALGVEVEGPLRPTHAGDRVKLVTFVPAEATAKVLDAVATAGAGEIGEYTHCSFRVGGTGTFLPSAAANPAIGARGELNEVPEERLEVVVPAARAAAAAEALRDAHPYEEVAYDLVPLEGRAGLGLGRVGRPDAPLTAGELAARAAERLGAPPRLAGDPDREVRRVAVCGGSGSSLIADARRARADAYLTADLTHHVAQEGGRDLTLIDAGHYATERPFVPVLAEALRAKGLGEVLVSDLATDPFGAP